MNFLARAKLTSRFFKLVSDPTRTDLIFEILDLILKNAPTEQLEDFEKRFQKHEDFIEQWNDRYDPPHPSIDQLAQYPVGTFGHALHVHLTKYNLDLEFYPKMSKDQLIEYISHRVSQDHDYWHVLLGKTIEVEDELGLQAFGVAQFGSILGVLICSGGLLHLFRKDPKRALNAFEKIAEGYSAGKRAKFLPAVKVREHLGRPLSDVRRDLGIAV